jgi:ribosomal protein S25
MLGELSKIGALTPYSIATQFNIRLSVAKDILEELGKIKFNTRDDWKKEFEKILEFERTR